MTGNDHYREAKCRTAELGVNPNALADSFEIAGEPLGDAHQLHARKVARETDTREPTGVQDAIPRDLPRQLRAV